MNLFYNKINLKVEAPVAQLDRALGYGPGRFWVQILAGAPR